MFSFFFLFCVCTRYRSLLNTPKMSAQFGVLETLLTFILRVQPIPSGAIATTATHAGNAECIAARQTRQVAHQAAAKKGLRSVAQHRTRQGNLWSSPFPTPPRSETCGR